MCRKFKTSAVFYCIFVIHDVDLVGVGPESPQRCTHKYGVPIRKKTYENAGPGKNKIEKNVVLLRFLVQ